jgi:hypothetical protein
MVQSGDGRGPEPIPAAAEGFSALNLLSLSLSLSVSLPPSLFLPFCFSVSDGGSMPEFSWEIGGADVRNH